MKFNHNFFKRKKEQSIKELREETLGIVTNIATGKITRYDEETVETVKIQTEKIDAELKKLSDDMAKINAVIDDFTKYNAAHITQHREWIKIHIGTACPLVRRYSKFSKNDLIALSKGDKKKDLAFECEIAFKEAVEKQASSLKIENLHPGFAINNYLQMRKTGVRPRHVGYMCEAIVDHPNREVVETANKLLKVNEPYYNKLKEIKANIQINIDELTGDRAKLNPAKSGTIRIVYPC